MSFDMDQQERIPSLETRPPRTVLFFSNGNSAVFDADDRQMPELQEPWILLFAKFLESKGVDPLSVEYKLQGERTAVLFKTSDGSLSWRIL